MLGCSGGRECLESRASPRIEPMDLVRGVRDNLVLNGTDICAHSLPYVLGVGLLASLPLGLQVSMTPMILGLPLSR